MLMIKIISVVGARPNFIKIAPVYRAFQKYTDRAIHKICHTGQHFDTNMSRVFFEELEIPAPDFNLGIHGGSHARQVAKIMMEFEKVLLQEKPDLILVPGDVNSTMAVTLVASKMGIPVGHIESGLRSFDRTMPEEINRILTDHCADLLFCPTETAVNNLEKEGFSNIANNGKLIEEELSEKELSAFPAPWNPKAIPLGSFQLSPLVINVGDTMYDAVSGI